MTSNAYVLLSVTPDLEIPTLKKTHTHNSDEIGMNLGAPLLTKCRHITPHWTPGATYHTGLASGTNRPLPEHIHGGSCECLCMLNKGIQSTLGFFTYKSMSAPRSCLSVSLFIATLSRAPRSSQLGADLRGGKRLQKAEDDRRSRRHLVHTWAQSVAASKAEEPMGDGAKLITGKSFSIGLQCWT